MGVGWSLVRLPLHPMGNPRARDYQPVLVVPPVDIDAGRRMA